MTVRDPDPPQFEHATPPIAGPRPGRKPQLPALTGIRTVLALGIVLFHFTPPHLGPLYPIIDNSFVFVGCFFLISGFILTYNYSDRALTLSKRDFWVARFSRLYPVYLLVLVLSFDMLRDEWGARSHAEFWRGVVLTPLLLQGWSPKLATFGNTVAWTLSCEVMFYFAFPFLLYAWARRMHWLDTPGRLIALILGLWCFGMLPHLLYGYFNPDHLAAPANRYTSSYLLRLLKYTPPPYVCTFLSGVALGRLHPLLPMSRWQRFWVALASFGLFVAFFYTGAVRHVPYLILHGGFLVPLFCLMILGLAGPNPIASLFSIKPIVLIGEATFALYLLHFNMFLLIHKYHLPQRLHLAALEPWLSYIAILGLAFFTLHFVENPGRKAILNRFGSRRRG
ncbi:MAG: acyltransferase [Acidobacteriota bacterium]|nr:acyltransferase [Acidobacteriota bacterium]